MCNLYTQTKSVDEIAAIFRNLQMPLRFPEGAPNLKPGDICITDQAPIVRSSASEPGAFELVVRRWSWPGPGGKPVYNFRSDGREFPLGRCLAIADGFYEFTPPQDPKRKRKDRWLFRRSGEPLVGIAGFVRATQGIREAFTLLTTTPGPDILPYHHRQVAIVAPDMWRAWLEHEAADAEVLRPSPPGSLSVSPATLSPGA